MSEERRMATRACLIRAADREKLVEESFRHPLAADAELHAYALGREVGLERTGVSLVRVPPGRRSYPQHVHAAEEEWLFVLRGKGVLELGDETLELGAGDFAGFPAGARAHDVVNTQPDEDLVYLCGGERAPVDVIDFPQAGRRFTRVGHAVTVFPASAGEPLASRRG